MQGKLRRAAFIVSLIVAGLLGLWLVTRGSGPRYEGRSLTKWIGVLGTTNPTEEARAFAAIQAIGTNGLPTIIGLLSRADSPEWRRKAKIALILSGAESQHASMPAVVRLSMHSDAGVRLTAVELLAGVVFAEPLALQALELRRRDVDPRVRAAADQAMTSYEAAKKMAADYARQASQPRPPEKKAAQKTTAGTRQTKKR